MLAKIYITPKQGVLDPQGKAITSSLHTLGFDQVRDVRMGKYLEVHVDEGSSGRQGVEKQVRAMCDRLLANGVIEDFHFDLVEESPR